MSLIVSVLTLDRHAIHALKMTDPYSLHRVVYSLYPDIRAEEDKMHSHPSGILYADQGADPNGRKILMLANRPPAERVDGRFGEVRSKTLPDGFLDHTSYRFKIIINPTRRENASRRLVALRTRKAISDWFLERAPISWGFHALATQLEIDGIEVKQFRDKKQRQVTIGQAQIRGILHVTNREQFKASVSLGIGRARTYGCGLLQIVPVIDNPSA